MGYESSSVWCCDEPRLASSQGHDLYALTGIHSFHVTHGNAFVSITHKVI